VAAGELDTGLVERELDALTATSPEDDRIALVAAAMLRLVQAEPRPGTVVDPFDLPGGWRLTGPAPHVLHVSALGGEPVEVRLTGRAADATVVVGDAEPVRASAAVEGQELVVTVDG